MRNEIELTPEEVRDLKIARRAECYPERPLDDCPDPTEVAGRKIVIRGNIVNNTPYGGCP